MTTHRRNAHGGKASKRKASKSRSKSSKRGKGRRKGASRRMRYGVEPWILSLAARGGSSSMGANPLLAAAKRTYSSINPF